MEDKSKSDPDKKSSARLITDSDTDMSYWLELSVEDFIPLLVHDIRHELSSIHTLVDLVNNAHIATEVKLDTLGNKYTIKDVCEILLQREARIENAISVASAYGKHTRKT